MVKALDGMSLSGRALISMAITIFGLNCLAIPTGTGAAAPPSNRILSYQPCCLKKERIFLKSYF
jgi:hypothetical protein